MNLYLKTDFKRFYPVLVYFVFCIFVYFFANVIVLGSGNFNWKKGVIPQIADFSLQNLLTATVSTAIHNRTPYK